MLDLFLALAPVDVPEPLRVVIVDATVDATPRDTLRVVLSNGTSWRLRPCTMEDSRTCYWDARARGNHIGRSFVNVRGTIIFTHRI